jgi:phage FluMu gp28-like protein
VSLLASPIVPLYRCQHRFASDRSRLKGWLKSRQVGGSFTGMLEVSLDAVETGEDWNTMSRCQRQAKKLLLKAANHLGAINRFTVQELGRPPIVDEDKIGPERIVLRNGACISALPCDPDTTVGDTCNWFIDEFSLFPKSDLVFGVIKPSIRLGKKLRIVSTPRGPLNKFAELYRMWEEQGSACGWSWHRTTIEDAIADGFYPVDEKGNRQTLGQFRKQEIRDIGMDMYLQEYMCVFSDKLVVYLPHSLILKNQASHLPMVRPMEWFAGFPGELYVGVDIGRTRNATVIWVLSRSGDNFMAEAVFGLFDTPFEEQERVLGSILRSGRVGACCIDRQGNGMQLTEGMEKVFPGVVHGVNFSNLLKAEMASRLRATMELGNFTMPDDEDLADDFASIQRNITAAGNVQIAAPQSGHGHGDYFWAAALALHAVAKYPPFQFVMAG